MNLFDSANYPSREPTELVIGDRWLWKRTDLGSDYPPASYALSYGFRFDGSDAAPEIDISATESGADYIVEVASTITAAYKPGRYRWQAYITRSSDSQRLTISSGIVTLKSNADSDAITDPRTHARKCLDSIEAALEAFAGDAVQSYSITTGTGSRTVTKRETADLLVLRDRYKAEVSNELIAEKVASGLGNPRLIGVRFQRV